MNPSHVIMILTKVPTSPTSRGLARCWQVMDMPWSTSDRRSRLPSDWAQRVAKVKARDKRCMDRYHAPDCDGRAAEVDHIVQGDDHSLTNLQALSVACHARKTRLDNGYRAAVKSPPEQHPGTR